MVDSCFDISTADDFYEKVVKPQHQDFLDNNASARYALLSILVTYHLHEWVGGKFKFGEEKKYKHKFFQEAFLERYPGFETEADYFDVARRICNDTKHFNKDLKKQVETRTQTGFSSFFSDFFARPLMIKISEDKEVSVDCLLKCLLGFWKKMKDDGKF